MKKIISLIVVAVLVAAMFATTAFAAGTSLDVSEATTVAGGSATLSVTVSGNTGFSAASIYLSYNSEYLTITSITPVKMGSGLSGNPANGKTSFSSSSLLEGDGTLFTVTFAVAENTPADTYPVTISNSKLVNNLNNDRIDLNESVSGGSITVTAPEKPTDPTESEPTESEPTEPKPTESEPTEPKPTESEPTEPKPTESEPTEPKPTESEPTEPKPTESEPTEPKPTESEPTEPKPTESEPTEPKPTESESTEPSESESTEPSETQKPTTEPEEETDPGKDDEPKNGDITPYPVFFLLAVMAVAATAFVLKRKFDI